MTRDLTRAVLNEITSRGFTCSDGDSPGTIVLTPSQDPETSASGTPAHTILTLPLKELHEVVEALGGVQWFVDTLLEEFQADATGRTTYIMVSGSPAGVHSRWRLAPGLRTDAAARDAALSTLHDRELSRRARKGERFVWTDEPESFSG